MAKKVKKGQTWFPKLGGTPIEIVSRQSGNGHWNTRKTNGSHKSHRVHEKTLIRHYYMEDK